MEIGRLVVWLWFSADADSMDSLEQVKVEGAINFNPSASHYPLRLLCAEKIGSEPGVYINLLVFPMWTLIYAGKFCRKAYSSYMHTCIHADYLHVHHLKFVHCVLVVAFICSDSHTQSNSIQSVIICLLVSL